MGFVQAIKSAYANYANFDGRASRSEFLWFCFFYVGVLISLQFLQFALVNLFSYLSNGSLALADDTRIVFDVASFCFFLSGFLPYLAVSVRRLHDMNWPGWWCLVFIYFLPILGLFSATVGDNRYGPTTSAPPSPSAATPPPQPPARPVTTKAKDSPQRIAVSSTLSNPANNRGARSKFWFTTSLTPIYAALDQNVGFFRLWVVFTVLWIAACAAYGAAFEKQFENNLVYTVDLGRGPLNVMAPAGMAQDEVEHLAFFWDLECVGPDSSETSEAREDTCDARLSAENVLLHQPNFWPLILFALGGSLFGLATLIGILWVSAGFKQHIE